MNRIRRLIAWSCFASFLGFVGVGVYHFVPNRPLCAIQGDFRFAHFSGDGYWILTQRAFGEEEADELRVWNAQTGQLEKSYRTSRAITVLADSQHFYWYDLDPSFHFVNWHNGKAWSPGVNWGLWDYLGRGRWWAVYKTAQESADYYLFDTHQFKVTRKLNVWPILFSNDERLVVGLTAENRVAVEEAESGRQSGIIAIEFPKSGERNRGDFLNDIRLTSDGRWLIHALHALELRMDDMPREGENPELFRRTAKGFEVWELATQKRCWRFESPAVAQRSVLVSRDGNVLATWPTNIENGTLELFEAATGRKLAAIAIKREWQVEFSPDSGRLLFQYVDEEKVAMIDVAAGRILWEATCQHYPKARFIDSASVTRQSEECAPFDILDAQTGRVKSRLLRDHVLGVEFSPDRSFGIFRGIHWAGRQVDFWERCWANLVPNWEDDYHHVYIGDLKAGCIRFRTVLREEDSCYLSDDGKTLVTVESRDNGENGGLIQVWDVCRVRAQIWGWLSAIILGASLLSLRRWRLQRKAAL